MKKNYILLSTAILLFSLNNVSAQFSVNGQLMQRAEYMEGYGTLTEASKKPAMFIGQRARINTFYKNEKFKVYVSGQDIRTFGSATQLKLTDGYFSIYEAWGEIYINKHFTTKIGRQELDYDDARILGNVDWALQGRSHDFALLKYSDSLLMIHAGGTYNQDKQTQLSDNYFSTAGQYKAAHFLWMNRQFKNLNISAVFWNNGMQHLDSSTKYMQTFGLPKIEYKHGKIITNAFYYHQTGKDVTNKTVNAFDANFEVSYNTVLNDSLKRKLRVAVGAEYMSGTSQTDASNTENNSFNPLYGTAHRHNGYMDYFFVGGRQNNSVGLQDVYFKIKYDINSKLFLSLNNHWFSATANVKDKVTGVAMNNSLGIENDLTFGWLINEDVSLQAGYSRMFATNTMETLRGGNASDNQQWAYVSLLYRPNMKNKFTGLKF